MREVIEHVNQRYRSLPRSDMEVALVNNMSGEKIQWQYLDTRKG